MSVTFTKLFSSITESTVWCEPAHTRLVWITMLAMADRKGRVWASIPGLANRARVPLEDAEKALGTFLAPDVYSRTPDHDGRRIEPIDGGWRLLNYAKYRAIQDQEQRQEYKREWDRTKRLNPTKSDKSDIGGHQTTQAEAEAEAVKANSTSKEKAMRSHGSRLPLDWEPSAALIGWAETKRPDLDLTETLANFRDYWKAATGKGATKLDWDAAFRTWVRGQRVAGNAPLKAVGTRPSIVCADCQKRVFTWTSGRCDPCWRAQQGLAA